MLDYLDTPGGAKQTNNKTRTPRPTRDQTRCCSSRAGLLHSHQETRPKPSSFMLPVMVMADGASSTSVRSTLVPRSLPKRTVRRRQNAGRGEEARTQWLELVSLRCASHEQAGAITCVEARIHGTLVGGGGGGGGV